MNTEIKNNTLIAIVAILTIAGLEITAIFNGINGTMFSISLALIGLIAGVSLPQLKLIKN